MVVVVAAAAAAAASSSSSSGGGGGGDNGMILNYKCLDCCCLFNDAVNIYYYRVASTGVKTDIS